MRSYGELLQWTLRRALAGINSTRERIHQPRESYSDQNEKREEGPETRSVCARVGVPHEASERHGYEQGKKQHGAEVAKLYSAVEQSVPPPAGNFVRIEHA